MRKKNRPTFATTRDSYLASQLRRINAQITCLGMLKERVADAEERCKEDLTAATSSGGSIDSSSSKDEVPGGNASATTTTSSSHQDAKGRWAKQYDTEVQAEYWYNDVTAEASWLDPRYGSMAVYKGKVIHSASHPSCYYW
jgi:hypothetical protein